MPVTLQNRQLNISLIIPAYNEENYIGACLDHVLMNSHGRFTEIIVIDNASTDRTAEIAITYPGVRVVREEVKGLTKARQRGYIEAQGDILAYIDADTRMPPFWYDSIVRHFSSAGTLACLSGPYVYYEQSSLQKMIIRFYCYLLMMPVYLLVGYMVNGGNFAIRREILNKMEGFDTSIEFYGEDANIARRASSYGRVAFDPSFVMPTSARRFAGQGLLRTAWLYASNYFAEVLWQRPYSHEYKDIR